MSYIVFIDGNCADISYLTLFLPYVQFRVMEQVVIEDKEEQEKLRQEQEQIEVATKVIMA